MLMRYTDQTQIANWNQFESQTTYIWHDLNNNKASTSRVK